jgi:hypothetical protein
VLPAPIPIILLPTCMLAQADPVARVILPQKARMRKDVRVMLKRCGMLAAQWPGARRVGGGACLGWLPADARACHRLAAAGSAHRARARARARACPARLLVDGATCLAPHPP